MCFSVNGNQLFPFRLKLGTMVFLLLTVEKGDEAMKIESLQELASQIGLHQHSTNTSQKMLIRAIQKQRGEEPCFSTDKRYNCHEVCEWSTSCQKLRAVWLR